MTTITLDHVLNLAHQLNREQRGQLIARLVLELAQPEPPAAAPSPPALGQFQTFTAAFRAAYPAADVSGQLDADQQAHNVDYRDGEEAKKEGR